MFKSRFSSCLTELHIPISHYQQDFHLYCSSFLGNNFYNYNYYDYNYYDYNYYNYYDYNYYDYNFYK